MELRGKKVLVAGAGKSGISAIMLLEKVEAVPVLYDLNENPSLPEGLKVDMRLGAFKEEYLTDIDLLVISPGIPIDSEIVLAAVDRNIPVWGEIELAYNYEKGSVVAITGTNGKTTTTALTGKIMEAAFSSVFVVGNIGIPYADKVCDTDKESVTVAEISSFQLETVHSFAPKVTAILNITPDHLNRHKTMENYIAVKESITLNQSQDDVCILNYEDEALRAFASTLKCKVIFFSSRTSLDEGLVSEDGYIVYKHGALKETVCRIDDMKIIGEHNVENAMAAAAAGIAMGIDIKTIGKVICDFEAIEHRIEFVKEVKGVLYYNDSKGTNPDSSIKAVNSMTRPTFLIAGGSEKNSDYTEFARTFKAHLKKLVLIGVTKEKIAASARAEGFTDIVFQDTMEDAIRYCYDNAVNGDAVLLSPACASFDMFKNYEERGRIFKEYVRSL
ncbi:MAG: UDP-N-acetylmuramoyl-L-alanine--D-glutamate ligase [Lachnospiraceae bacterium]|nr:UDP-N-acetylmuramoyl-L-alanine--D-glutamate ligase [Lachnospiraceae bacterium]